MSPIAHCALNGVALTHADREEILRATGVLLGLPTEQMQPVGEGYCKLPDKCNISTKDVEIATDLSHQPERYRFRLREQITKIFRKMPTEQQQYLGHNLTVINRVAVLPITDPKHPVYQPDGPPSYGAVLRRLRNDTDPIPEGTVIGPPYGGALTRRAETDASDAHNTVGGGTTSDFQRWEYAFEVTLPENDEDTRELDNSEHISLGNRSKDRPASSSSKHPPEDFDNRPLLPKSAATRSYLTLQNCIPVKTAWQRISQIKKEGDNSYNKHGHRYFSDDQHNLGSRKNQRVAAGSALYCNEDSELGNVIDLIGEESEDEMSRMGGYDFYKSSKRVDLDDCVFKGEDTRDSMDAEEYSYYSGTTRKSRSQVDGDNIEDEEDDLRTAWNIDAVIGSSIMCRVNDPRGYSSAYKEAFPAWRNAHHAMDIVPNLHAVQIFVRNVPHVVFVTKRPIYEGEELLLSYGELYWAKFALQKEIRQKLKDKRVEVDSLSEKVELSRQERARLNELKDETQLLQRMPINRDAVRRRVAESQRRDAAVSIVRRRVDAHSALCVLSLIAEYFGEASRHLAGNDLTAHYQRCKFWKRYKKFVKRCRTCGSLLVLDSGIVECFGAAGLLSAEQHDCSAATWRDFVHNCTFANSGSSAVQTQRDDTTVSGNSHPLNPDTSTSHQKSNMNANNVHAIDISPTNTTEDVCISTDTSTNRNDNTDKESRSKDMCTTADDSGDATAYRWVCTHLYKNVSEEYMDSSNSDAHTDVVDSSTVLPNIQELLDSTRTAPVVIMRLIERDEVLVRFIWDIIVKVLSTYKSAQHYCMLCCRV
eukprot:Lankesteria_metandrocarpae@DN4865_c2_g1_i4.p1